MVGKVQVVSHVVVEIGGCNESHGRGCLFADANIRRKPERQNVLLKKVVQNFPIPIFIATFASE